MESGPVRFVQPISKKRHGLLKCFLERALSCYAVKIAFEGETTENRSVPLKTLSRHALATLIICECAVGGETIEAFAREKRRRRLAHRTSVIERDFVSQRCVRTAIHLMENAFFFPLAIPKSVREQAMTSPAPGRPLPVRRDIFSR